ncbi:MAG: multiheme c-type cytochrome, partial [Anaerolineales bacterium]
TTFSRQGVPLTALSPGQSTESSILRNGRVEGWDWQASGTMEMNCFLCHLEKPNNQARIQAIRQGAFGWANAATLEGYLTQKNPDGSYTWLPEAFDEAGKLKPEYVRLQDPTNENCGQCHHTVHTDPKIPLVLESCSSEMITTGEIISPQRIVNAGMNIANKVELNRSWDIHAERQLKCTDCHFSLNNPAYANQKQEPSHLLFDPRRLEPGEYLLRPDHNFARGQSAQYNVAPELKGTMRRCESCHDAQKSHASWLPYVERHMAVVACESCHVPQIYAPAIEYYDWTVLKADGQPQTACRGVESAISAEIASISNMPFTVSNLVEGYQPILLARTNIDGKQLLAPYNLITTFYWVYEDNKGNVRPVRLADLEAAYFKDGKYRAEIIAAFDADGNGILSENELVIDNTTKEEAVAAQLRALGLRNPRIQGQVQPYSINHNVADGDHAVHDCRACHGEQSRLTQPLKLANYTPAGLLPTFVTETNVNPVGEIVQKEDGSIYYMPQPSKEGIYIFGHSRVKWVDLLGALFFVGALFGVLGHGTLRYITSLRRPPQQIRTRRVYMYQA